MGTTWTGVLYFDPIRCLLVSVLITIFLASEEFDKLCFDYGLELDEDVRFIHIPGPT